MWAFLASDCMFFGSLISTHLVYRLSPIEGNPGPTDIFDIELTSISTFVLLMSSLAVVLALDFLRAGRRTLALFWTMMIIVLGAGFLGFQAYEFTHFYHVGLTLQQNIFGSSFFVLTGFHGAHVTIGVLCLLFTTFMAFRGRYTAANHGGVEIMGLYWHFVDLVWIILFTIAYLV
mgnify:CR=1 FL=1